MGELITGLGPDPQTYLERRAAAQARIDALLAAQEAEQDLARQQRQAEADERTATWQRLVAAYDAKVAETLEVRRLRTSAELPSFTQLFERGQALILATEWRAADFGRRALQASTYSDDIIIAEDSELGLRQVITVHTVGKRSKPRQEFELTAVGYTPTLIDVANAKDNGWISTGSPYNSVVRTHIAGGKPVYYPSVSGEPVYIPKADEFEGHLFSDRLSILKIAEMDRVFSYAEAALNIGQEEI